MAVVQTLTEAINAVERNNNTLGGVNDPTNYSKQTGALNYLLSPQNSNAISASFEQTSTGSKYRDVKVRYLPKKGDNEVIESDASGNCNKAPARREIVQTLTPSLYFEDKFTIEEDLMRNGTLEMITARLQREIQDSTRNGRENLSKQLLSGYASVLGSNPAAGTAAGAYTSLQLLLADGSVDPATFDTIMNHQMDNYMSGPVNVIGIGKFRNYKNLLSVGGPKDNGVDVRGIEVGFNTQFFIDHATEESLSNIDRIIVPYAGLSQFYQYNNFLGSDFAVSIADTGSVEKRTINDPIWGNRLKWDFIFKYDDNCDNGNGINGAWVGRILTYFDLWTPPEEAFGEGYSMNLNDFTGVVGYEITQAS